MRVDVSHVLSVKILKYVIFPLGHLTKWPLKWIEVGDLDVSKDLIPGLQKSVKELKRYVES
jgi:hypothetical protein